ncbi:MAG: DNA methyltransferase [candidate division Zixibacteria bacterium HGW-Zixibacteria-1]|nr:MAG: DNA methyltransferase [candidate division Zixibacteria bacterium HGW-Zixibacteria-1]
MSDKEISKYLKDVEKKLATGQAREHTYRPALENMLKALNSEVEVINDGRRIECGAPDLIINRGVIPIGYFEAKDIGKSLDDIVIDSARKKPKTHDGEQFKRFCEGLPNLILTDYLEFRWYYNGEHRMTARLASLDTKGKLKKVKDGEEEFRRLLTEFFAAQTVTVGTPKDLAARMASLAQIIRDIIVKAFASEDKGGKFHEEMEGFRKVLLHDLDSVKFADMYAQTICYGLFAARCNHDESKPFDRKSAIDDLPKTNPFLRKMFDHMAGVDLDERVRWAVDNLAELLNRADIEGILKDFGKRTRQDDPVVHFYETFLAAYDPRLREMRGVYYTPKPVVSYIVRSIDHILKTDFGIADGLADTTKIPIYKTVEDEKGNKKQEKVGECHKVLILDPAVGTGTFLHGVIDHIHEHLTQKGLRGTWSSYVTEHLLPRLFGFELLMAPYAVAHLKLALQLKDFGYDFGSDERLNIFMTNTLEEALDIEGFLGFDRWVAEEANAAGKVKIEKPVMVILGNPPYSGHSANKGDWIHNLLRGKDTLTGENTGNYFEVDGKPLGERNPKWLNDDYVKFIRFAQWRIEKTGYGILGFISNHGYLDNPTFRGMRQSLMNTFEDIYILDLHGNTKKKEKCPDGSKDENVFDIQQGVAIGIFVKKGNPFKDKDNILHREMWGNRKGKYNKLHSSSTADTGWNRTLKQSPYYLFTNKDDIIQQEYTAYNKITKIFENYVVGIVTSRDNLVVDISNDGLAKKINVFVGNDINDETVRNKYFNKKASARYPLGDTREWKLTEARKKARLDADRINKIVDILYRPFDIRKLFYAKYMIDRPRFDIMQHMIHGTNLALSTTRSIEIGRGWEHVFCTKHIIQHHTVSLKEVNFHFPLYIYLALEKSDLFNNNDIQLGYTDRRPNLNNDFIMAFSNKINLKYIINGRPYSDCGFSPADVFNYIYAVFHSPTYRTRYAEFLKIDFPRVPLTSNKSLFRELCELGGELVGLHLMEKHGPDMARFAINDGNEVNKVRYTEPKGKQPGRVWINETQYFEGVPPEVWAFHIGGYQVCQKWLKDRKGRILNHDDVVHYCHIVSALSETIRLMSEIDKSIDKHGGWPIQ